MKDKIITTLNEYIEHNKQMYDMIVEYARINDLKQFPYDVFVYGGNSYGTGRNEHGDPHFHFSDDINNKNAKFNLSILIPEVNDWKTNKELIIIESNRSTNSWNGLKTEKKELIKWLDNYSKNRALTNIQIIRMQWNILNADNKNVKQVEE